MKANTDLSRRRLLRLLGKDKFGAAVGYLTGELTQFRLAKT
jgi:hypothetical protein